MGDGAGVDGLKMQSFQNAMFLGLLALAGCGTPQSVDANVVAATAPADNVVADNVVTDVATAPAASGAVAPASTAPGDVANEAVVGDAQSDRSLPADVVAFRAKRDECDHFRGEEPTDPARVAFLTKAMERTCTGTDAALIALRKRHAGEPAVLSALASYEEEVE